MGLRAISLNGAVLRQAEGEGAEARRRHGRRSYTGRYLGLYRFAQVCPAASLVSGSGPPMGIPWLSMRE
jgi:hypothetical protein